MKDKMITIPTVYIIVNNKMRSIYNKDELAEIREQYRRCSIPEDFRINRNAYDKFEIVTTRFTTETYIQNCKYRKKNNMMNDSIYNFTSSISEDRYPSNKYLIVLEMNNTTNQIMGIGLIKNVLATEQVKNLYRNPRFNNYTYRSKYHIQLINPLNIIPDTKLYKEELEDRYVKSIAVDKELTIFIDKHINRILFYGKGNLKRGQSVTKVPIRRLTVYHYKVILFIFMKINPNNINRLLCSKYLRVGDSNEDGKEN